ncbi:MAG: hypothetical protein DRG36_01715, partial [Deltaproteobacteria bacterium]
MKSLKDEEGIMEERMAREYEEVDLYDYLRVLWRWRWLILIGVVVVTLAAIPVSYLVRKYESRGVLRLSLPLSSLPLRVIREAEAQRVVELAQRVVELTKISLPEYKVYKAVFNDPHLFLRYLEAHRIIT